MKRALLLLIPAVVIMAPVPRFELQAGAPFEPPSLEHWFGTDDLGRDMLAGAIEGGRLSLLVGSGTAFLALFLGTLVGVSAGFAGGIWDEILMRIVEVFQVVPRFFLALVVLTIWEYDVWRLVLVLGITSWGGLARLARAETLSVKERAFVVAARASAANRSRLLFQHVLPFAVRPLLAAAPLIASGAMLTEAGLSFLGLGTLEHVSWGYLLQNAQPFLRDAWWMAVFPGLMMTTVVLVLALVALLSKPDVVTSLHTLHS